jgi:hypothetical protein
VAATEARVTHVVAREDTAAAASVTHVVARVPATDPRTAHTVLRVPVTGAAVAHEVVRLAVTDARVFQEVDRVAVTCTAGRIAEVIAAPRVAVVLWVRFGVNAPDVHA